MQINFTLAEGARAPTKATDGSAGFDLYCHQQVDVYNYQDKAEGKTSVLIDTGVRIEIPKGYVGLVFERSSLHLRGLLLENKVGVIDSDYRGPILLALRKRADYIIQDQEKLAQLVIVPCPEITLNQVTDLNETERGEGGFGSTGDK